MSYNLDLLCRQRKGKFSISWLAVTRGIKNIKNSEINEVKVAIICNDIIKYMKSDCLLPQRISIELSAQLLYGTVLIYSKQIKNLEGDTIFCVNNIIRSLFIKVTEKETKKSKKLFLSEEQEKLQPDIKEIMDGSELLSCEEIASNPNVVDPREITLPEEDYNPNSSNSPMLEPFGDEQNLFQFIDLFLATTTPSPKGLFNIKFSEYKPEYNFGKFNTITEEFSDGDSEFEVIDLDNPPISMLKSSPISTFPKAELINTKIDKHLIPCDEYAGQSPSKRSRTEKYDIFPLVNILEHGKLSPEGKDRLSTLPLMRPASKRVRFSLTELSSEEILENIERARNTKISKKIRIFNPRNTKSTSFKKLELRPVNKSPIVNNILKNTHLQKPYVSKEKIQENTDDIIVEMFKTINCTEEDLHYVIGGFELDQEPLLDLPRLSLLETPNLPSTKTEKKIQDIVDINQFNYEWTNVAKIESNGVSRIHLEVSEIKSESNRHSKLLDIIRMEFNHQSRETLEIKDICAPLNKLNVARTLNALLKFQTQQYVTLKPKAGHPETVLIYRGPLLLQ